MTKTNQSLSNAAVTYAQRRGLSLRGIAGIVEVAPSEISRIKARQREFSVSQFAALAQYFRMPLWQLLIHVMREFDDDRELNVRVAALAEELARDLNVQLARRPQSNPELTPSVAA